MQRYEDYGSEFDVWESVVAEKEEAERIKEADERESWTRRGEEFYELP